MDAGPCIDVRNVSRIYRSGDVEVCALRDVSLTIGRGDFVAIMGASGSGKSTLMAILGCLDRPSAGSYLLEGVDVAQLNDTELANIRSERLGFVFQSFNLLPRTSALDNVMLPLCYARQLVSKPEQHARACAALDLLGLAERADNTPAQLSGGQQQRVAIARALINAPRVLLADEPTGNLDSRTSHEIMETLVRLNREQGVTIVVVTHEPDIAAYANRVITMRDGGILTDQRNSHPTDVAARSARCVPIAARSPSKRAGAWSFAQMILCSAAQALFRNKTRSVLTMLGVFIGVAALIAMIAVGQGANQAVLKQIEGLGTNMFVVVPGSNLSGGVRAGQGSASTLTVDDARAIRHDGSSINAVSYLMRQSGQVQYRDQNWSTLIQGVTPSYPEITNWHLQEGRLLSADDDRGAALVAVIGDTVRRQLFPAGVSPLGASILVRGIPLRVVGLYAPKGQTAYGQDQDDVLMIPFTTAERRVLGVATPSTQSSLQTAYPQSASPFGLQPHLTGYVNQIYVQASSAAQVSAAIAEATATLSRRHHIKQGDPADFSVRNLSQVADMAEGSSRVMADLLAVVASISLLVGGIGIMNILLVSVTERTREIGLRMAIGAHRNHVLLQFLAEATFISVVGGVAGIVMGIGATQIIGSVAHWPTAASPWAMLGGFAFSAAVGIFFGFYPARKAAGLRPIEALRYE